jgi:uncharacterized protein (DUF302 family)
MSVPEQPTGAIVTKVSPWPVHDSIARLKDILDARGVKVFAVIDHSREAAKVGLELRDTKLMIFGNPVAGTPVMESAPLAALDLPLKILVWQDGEETKLSYTAPPELARRYGLSDELTAPLAAVEAVTNALIAG